MNPVAAYFGGIVGTDACRPRRHDRSGAETLRPVTGDRHGRADANGDLPPARRPIRTSSTSSLSRPAFAVPPDTPAKDVGRNSLPATGPYMRGAPVPAASRSSATRISTNGRRPRSPPATPTASSSRRRHPPGVPCARSSAATATSLSSASRRTSSMRCRRSTRVRCTSTRLARVTYLFMNTRVPPFDDVRVRQAVNFAIDRAAAARASTAFVGCGARRARSAAGLSAATSATARTRFIRARRVERSRPLAGAAASRRLGTRGALDHRVGAGAAPGRHACNGAATQPRLPHAHETCERRRLLRPDEGPLNPHSRAQAGLFAWTADLPAASNYFGMFSRAVRRTSRTSATGASRSRSGERSRFNRATRISPTGSGRESTVPSSTEAPVAPLYTLKEVDIASRRVGNFQYNPSGVSSSDSFGSAEGRPPASIAS